MEIIEVVGKALLKKFIDLPYRIHKNHQNWLPPIYSDDKGFFDKNRNNSFKGNQTVMFLAYENQEAIGRIMGIVPIKHNDKHGLNDARFCFLDTINDINVARALIHEVENWSKAYNCSNLIGPLAFSDKDPQGLEIDGIENRPLILTNVNFPFMVDFMAELGFTKKKDLVSFSIDVPDEYPDEYYNKYLEYKHLHKNLKILSLKSRLGVWRYLRPAMDLINEMFVEIYAHTPMSEKDIRQLANRFILLLKPSFIKGVINEKKELVAVVIALQDMVEGIQKAKGRLFPLGFLKILAAQRSSKDLILMLGGIKKGYRNIGLDYWLSLVLYDEIMKAKIIVVKSHLILEENVKTQAKMTKFGGRVNKRFRIYQREISKT